MAGRPQLKRASLLGEFALRKSIGIVVVLALLHVFGLATMFLSVVWLRPAMEALITDEIRAEQAQVSDALVSKDREKILKTVSESALAGDDGDQWVPTLQAVLPKGELIAATPLSIHAYTSTDGYRSWSGVLEYHVRAGGVSVFTVLQMNWISSSSEEGLRSFSYTTSDSSHLTRNQIGEVIEKSPLRIVQLLVAIILFVPVWIFVLASIWFMLFRAETKRKIVWSIVMMTGLHFAFFNFTEGTFYLQAWAVSTPEFSSFQVPLSSTPITIIAGYATPLILGVSIPLGAVFYWCLWWKRRGRREAARSAATQTALPPQL